MAVAARAALWDMEPPMSQPKSPPLSMPPPESYLRTFPSATSAFFHGILGALSSMFFLVIGGTYVGMGALAHDFDLSAWWLALSTVLVWAGARPGHPDFRASAPARRRSRWRSR